MTFNEYQEFTNTTVAYPEEFALEYLSLGLCSEAGELAGKFKKLIRDCTTDWETLDFSYETKNDIAKELGDVLWYVARLADELDIELDEVAEKNIEKLFSRKERGVLGGSGDNR